MSAPVSRSGRPRQATRPAPTNERPARIVSAATAVVLSRISPLSIAMTPNVAHAAAATPIARPNARARVSTAPGVSPVMVKTRTTLAPDAAKKSGAGYTMGRSPGWHDQQMDHRVLIVDDNGAFRAAARQLLERAGFSVVAEAESGAGGVEEAKAHRPDVAIVDVQLPDFDGFEVAARLSELDAAPRVILISSLDGADFGALVAGSSALGFVPKAELSGLLINGLLAQTG